MGCLATAQVGGEVKGGMENAWGLQWAAWNVQADLFFQVQVRADVETVFPILRMQ